MSSKNLIPLFLLMGLFYLTSLTSTTISLEKIWVVQKYNSDNQSYMYKSELKLRDATGFQLLPEGKCKVRQNTNSCGTMMPNEKIIYETVDGTWNMTNDSILEIHHIQFGDSTTKRWRIIGLTEMNLIVRPAFLP